MGALLTTALAAFVGQGVAFFSVVGLVWLVTRRWCAPRLAGRRVPVRGRAFDRAQLVHEVKHSVVTLVVGGVFAGAVGGLEAAGWAQLPAGLGPGGAWGAALTIIGLVLGNDLWFYGVHRLLHTPWFFKHIHSVHHRSVDVNPFTAYSFHAVEAALLTAWLVPVALLVPLPAVALGVVQGIGFANNLMAHLGYELLPAWWLRAPGLRWSNTATFHSLHHTRHRGNFGLFTRLWDRLFGTEINDYEEVFARAHGQDPGRPQA
jgi:sterol desaturase/sphingolipid hydroxylase (fatty acid hydroxylase superfamily)